MDAWHQDLRSALRSLAARRGFVAACVACLGVGIGLVSMVYSLTSPLLLRPFSLEDPEGLVLVDETRRGAQPELSAVSYPNYRDWRERIGALAELAAVRPRGVALADGGEPARVPGVYASGNLFRVLGVAPALGRGFREDEDRPGAEPVVVLSDALWRQRYAGDEGVLGRVVSIEGRPHTVVGVMPPHFAFPRSARLWVPLAPADHDAPRDQRTLGVYARLERGVTAEQLEARLMGVATELVVAHPEANRDRGVVVRPLSARFSERTRTLLTMMMGAVALVLLIACADVANLMLARGVERQRELAMRRALGATRGRLLRQVLLESALVGLASVPLGLMIAAVGLERIGRALPPALRPDAPDFSLDLPAVALALAAALATSLLAGLWPALQASRASLRETLGDEGTTTAGPRQSRTRDALVVAEVTLSVVLLVGAGLFLRSFLDGLRANAGFEIEPLLTLGFDMPGGRYASAETRSRRVEDVRERLRALPGVSAVALTDFQPLRGGGSHTTAIREDGDDAPAVLVGGVTADYFETLGVPIVRGRRFSELEARTLSGVAIVNRTLAERLWPGESPVGRRFRLGDDPEGNGFAVTGVAGDVLTWDLSSRPQPSAFLPYIHVAARTPTVVMRVSGDPARLAGPAREAVRAADATLPVIEPMTMSEVQHLTFWRRRVLRDVFGGFGIAALLLAALGAYSVLAYWVGRRRREIGVRLALGADRGDVVGLVVRQGMRPVASGLALGLLGGVAFARVLHGRVYGLAGDEALSFAAVLLLMAVVGLASCLGPASRAAAMDPVRALRE